MADFADGPKCLLFNVKASDKRVPVLESFWPHHRDYVVGMHHILGKCLAAVGTFVKFARSAGLWVYAVFDKSVLNGGILRWPLRATQGRLNERRESCLRPLPPVACLGWFL